MRKAIMLLLLAAPLALADDAKSIEKEVVVSAPRDAVWRAWSTAEGAKTFFAPDAKIELAPCGAYEIYFNPANPPGSRGGESNQVVTFDAERLLLFTWNAPPKFGERYRHEHTYVLLRLDDAAGGGTRVRLTHFGWRDGDAWPLIRDYFDKAWDFVLANFKAKYK